MIEIEMRMKPDILGHVIGKAAALLKPAETLTAERFQQFLNPLKQNLYNFISKALNFSQDADDVYQETVLRAFKYRHSFKPEKGASFKTWLFTVAHNEIKKYFNTHKKKTAAVNLEDHPEFSADTAGDEHQRRMVRDIYETAQELNPRWRKVFFLFYDQRFSIKEIETITGLKEGNIKYILNQAREKIKEKIGVNDESKN
jgi:RNA polymerase sigma-70 factor (ECF subfamily)